MISEPELVGEEPFGAPEVLGPRPAGSAGAGAGGAETVGDGDAGQGGGPGGRRLPRQAWLWALGGAVVASAVWAGGVYAYGPKDPDLGGYRAAKNLCKSAKLKALTSEIGAMNAPASHVSRRHVAMDMASCSADLGEPPGGSEEPVEVDGEYEFQGQPSYVEISYVLHKRTDPGPEFEATAVAEASLPDSEITKKRVNGLGEQAYFVGLKDDVGPPRLFVLDGQAVFTLGVSGGYSDDGEKLTDLSGAEALMISDMRALMAELKK
ncbi:hypothetical protein [Streptomyces sp. NPDC002889]|uniref:hypothetical protein n=1 Tax=Streptomyces sp. NPDC002889 TaxID=3364669 RepID=UPI00369ADC83